MIKAVIFDIDNTLYNFDRVHTVAMEGMYAYAASQLGMDRESLDRSAKQAAGIVRQRLGADCAAIHNRALRLQVMLEGLGLPLEHALTMSEHYWDTLIGLSAPEPGALECLTRLRKAGYVLGIGTDMTLEYQLKKLKRLQMLPLFDFLVCSEEVNAEKPDPKLFLTCAKKAGVSPEECLFIGDNVKKDVLGPRAVGMQSLWYCPSAEKAAAHPQLPRLCHYDQLLEMLVNQKEGMIE